MYLNSQPGDYVGQGLSHTFYEPPGESFTIQGNPGVLWYRAFSDDRSIWDVNLIAPAGQTLVAGRTYPVQRYGFQQPGFAGLDVSGEGRECDGIAGSFTVNRYSMYKSTSSWFYHQLDISFSQRCSGSSGILTGRITFNAPYAPSTVPPVTITGPPARGTTFGTTVPLSGTAWPGDQVAVWFREAGSSSYVQRRTLTASPTGTWNTSYVATDDYSIYATSGNGQTPPVLVRVAPTIAGGASHVVRRGSTYTVTGTAIPRQPLTLHFHKAGSAANDYSILRTVAVGDNGTWSRAYVATTDYRFFASLPSGQQSPTVLVQAR